MLAIAYKFKTPITCVILLIIAVIFFNVWLKGKQQDAINGYKAKLEIAVNNQVQSDAKKIQDSFNNPSDGVVNRSREWVQQYEATASSRLQGVAGSSTAAESRTGGIGAIDLRAHDILSDSEIDFIRRNAHILQ